MDKKLAQHWLEILQTPNWEEHMKVCGPSLETLLLDGGFYENNTDTAVCLDREGNVVTLRDLNDDANLTFSQMADMIRYFV